MQHTQVYPATLSQSTTLLLFKSIHTYQKITWRMNVPLFYRGIVCLLHMKNTFVHHFLQSLMVWKFWAQRVWDQIWRTCGWNEMRSRILCYTWFLIGWFMYKYGISHERSDISFVPSCNWYVCVKRQRLAWRWCQCNVQILHFLHGHL